MGIKMKRFLTTAIIVLLCFLLQTTMFHHIALADEVPNLILIIVVAIGYMRGRKEGIYIGISCGLLLDLTYGCNNLVGLLALLYLFIGYFAGICNEIYYKDDLTVPIIVIAISDFVYNFGIYVFTFLLRGRLDVFYYIRRIILPELVYTLLIAVVLYKFLHFVNSLLERNEYKEVA